MVRCLTRLNDMELQPGASTFQRGVWVGVWACGRVGGCMRYHGKDCKAVASLCVCVCVCLECGYEGQDRPKMKDLESDDAVDEHVVCVELKCN